MELASGVTSAEYISSVSEVLTSNVLDHQYYVVKAEINQASWLMHGEMGLIPIQTA